MPRTRRHTWGLLALVAAAAACQSAPPDVASTSSGQTRGPHSPVAGQPGAAHPALAADASAAGGVSTDMWFDPATGAGYVLLLNGGQMTNQFVDDAVNAAVAALDAKLPELAEALP